MATEDYSPIQRMREYLHCMYIVIYIYRYLYIYTGFFIMNVTFKQAIKRVKRIVYT